MGKAAGVDPSWVNVGATEVTGRRRRHLLAGGLALTNSIFTSDAANTTSNLQKAVSDGSLAAGLSALGMTLDVNSITYSDPPGGGAIVGAIVGGVIGGLIGLALLIAVVLYCLKKRKAKMEATLPTAAATGTKTGETMYSGNPTFDGTTVAAPEAAVPKSSQPPPRTTTENAMFDVDMMGETPKVATTVGAAAGTNALFDSQQSQLSEPDVNGYAPDATQAAVPYGAGVTAAAAGVGAAGLAAAVAVGGGGMRENVTFKETENILADSDGEDFADAGNNPMFQSSGTDLMASAESDLQMSGSNYGGGGGGGAATGAAATAAAAGAPVFATNPSFKDTGNILDSDGDVFGDASGANPVFQSSSSDLMATAQSVADTGRTPSDIYDTNQMLSAGSTIGNGSSGSGGGGSVAAASVVDAPITAGTYGVAGATTASVGVAGATAAAVAAAAGGTATVIDGRREKLPTAFQATPQDLLADSDGDEFDDAGGNAAVFQSSSSDLMATAQSDLLLSTQTDLLGSGFNMRLTPPPRPPPKK